MPENHVTKGFRHTKIHVTKIGLLGRELATFYLVGDISTLDSGGCESEGKCPLNVLSTNGVNEHE
jgi:hypothetical protein